MPVRKAFQHAVQCADNARAAAERSVSARERARSSASRAAELSVLSDERLAGTKQGQARLLEISRPRRHS